MKHFHKVTVFLFIFVSNSIGCDISPTYQGIQSAIASLSDRKKFVVLTFDDGPSTLTTPDILKILKEHHIKSTFFVIGQNASRNNHLLKDIHEDGHEIGNHSMTHANLGRLGALQQTREVDKATHIIETETPQDVQWFRPPYGSMNQSLLNILGKKSLKPALWSIDPKDWANPTPAKLEQRIMKHLHNGAIILLHDHHKNTVIALPKIIESIEKEGYEIVTLTQWYQSVCSAKSKLHKKASNRKAKKANS